MDGKGAKGGYVEGLLRSPEGPAATGTHALAVEPDRMVISSKDLSRGRSKKRRHKREKEKEALWGSRARGAGRRRQGQW